MSALPARVYRVTRTDFAKSTADALSGIGGLYDEGRWHQKGRRIVYTSVETSGCLMERIVHGDEWIAERHNDRVMLTIELPQVSSLTVLAKDLTDHDPLWKSEGNTYCRRIGELWLANGKYCALTVPSAANPHSSNVLLNPLHPEFAAIIALNEKLQIEPLIVDDRVVSIAEAVRAYRGLT